MNIYYVYFYLRDDFSPYYVGKGTKKRAWKKNKNEIRPPRDKTKILIIKNNISLMESFYLERYYINWFGRKDIGTGILRNKSAGGEGIDSESARITTNKMVVDGTHPWLKRKDGSSWGSDVNKERVKKGTHPFQKSENENSVYKLLTIEERQKRGKNGGKVSGKFTFENKLGIHGLTKEQQLINASKGGKAVKGIPKSNKIKNELKEYIWIRNDTESTKIKYYDTIPDGWWKGKIINKKGNKLYENI